MKGAVTDRFEYFGEWWDVNDPGTRWSGTLCFDPVDGAVLQVIDPTRIAGFITTLREYDAILGETTSGKDVTLLRCFDRSAGGGLGTLGNRKIFANAVLVGFHGEGRDPLLSTAVAVFQHAPSWWGQAGISLDHSVTWPDATVHYRRPATVQVFNDGDLDIKIYATLASLTSGADRSGEFHLREEVRIELHVNTPRPLSAIEEIVHVCQDLLSISCQRYCGVERLTVFGPKDEQQEATLHAVPFFKQPSRGRDDWWPGLLFFRDIKDRPTQVFGAWLENAERLSPVRALYFLAIYGQNFIQGRFLALAQAVEAFHRRCRGGLYMDASDFETTVLAPIASAIPIGIDHSLSQSLRNRIKFGNEYSLRKRLTLLFREHKMALGKIVPDASRFVEPIATQRNSMTHFPLETQRSSFDSEEWLRYNFLLRLLLELCFLKTMGFSDDEVGRFADRNEDYKARAQRLFRPSTAAPRESEG